MKDNAVMRVAMSGRLRGKLGAILCVAASVACSEGSIVRKVALTAEPNVPGGTSNVLGGELRLEFESAEPLEEGHHFAWAETPTEFIALGEVESGESHVVALEELGALSDITAIFVTEETDETPEAPSLTTVVRGQLAGELLFGGDLEAESFHEALGEATLEDETVEVRTVGLPELPRGFDYGVWLDFGEALGGDGHEDTHDEDAGPLWVGDLSDSGTLHASLTRNSFTASACRITIESEHGEHTMASTLVLTGQVVTEPGAGTALPGAAPEEPAGDGHDHIH